MGRPAGGWLQAGRVGRPHGLDGSFHVREASARLLELGAEVVIDGLPTRPSRIVRRAGDDRHPIVRLEGHESRAAAEDLKGRQLLVPRDDAPELEDDEWWAEDLVGCNVRDADREVGTVVRLLALPSCEVLEVARSHGSGELLVPLVADAVRSVDVERKAIDVDLRFLGAE
jgi:16S rRNA processing protein RimM